MKQDKVRVLLVDDHNVLLSGLRLLLGHTPDLEVVGEASDRVAALEQCRTLRPGVLVLDINLENNNGLDLIPEIRKISAQCNIILLTMYNEEAYLQRALELGARGYILKTASEVELLSAIRAVGRGETYLDPALAKYLVERAMGKGPYSAANPSVAGELSAREREVLGCIALGCTNQQIATELVISIKTVETHKTRIKTKLGLQKRSDLVRYALDHHLVPKK